MANDHGIESSAAADMSRQMIHTAAAPVVRETRVFIKDAARDTIHGASGITGQAARIIINRDLVRTDSGLGIRKEDGTVRPVHAAGRSAKDRIKRSNAAGIAGRSEKTAYRRTAQQKKVNNIKESKKKTVKKQVANYRKKAAITGNTDGNYGIAKAAGVRNKESSQQVFFLGTKTNRLEMQNSWKNRQEIMEGVRTGSFRKIGFGLSKENFRVVKRMAKKTVGASKKLMKATAKSKRIAEVMGSGDAKEMTERVSMMGFNAFVRVASAAVRFCLRQVLALFRWLYRLLLWFAPGIAFALIAILILFLCAAGTQSAQQIIRSRQNAYSSMAVGRVSGARIASLGTGCDWNTYHTNTCYNASGPNPYQGQYGLDAYSGARGHNCTAYAWGRFYEITGEGLAACTGDALSWYRSAVNEGIWATGQTPMVGAVVVWDYGTGHGGHVAVIEEIKEDGTITTSNSGYSSSCRASHTGTNRSPEGHRCIWYNETFAGEAAIERAHGIFCGYIYPWHIGEEPLFGNTGTVTSNFTDEDMRYLAACIYMEGGSGYDYEGMLAVGTVVMNRIDNPSFPDTIQGVITQPYQFEVTTLSNWSSTLANPPEPAIACAQDLLNGTRSTRISSRCIAFRAASMGRAWLSSYHYNRSVNVNGNLFGWQE